MDRWVPVSERGLQTLIRAAGVQGQGRNLIPAHHTWAQFNHHLHAVTAPVLARYHLSRIHDGRAAYACERYQDLTHHPAPVAGHREASKAADRQARRILAQELGHHRIAVREHLQRAERIGEAIWRRWQVSPRQWQVKHLRWYLEQALRDRAPTTRYDHWRTVRALIHALGKAEAWTAHLRGPWLRPQGKQGRPLGIGRPAKLPPG